MVREDTAEKVTLKQRLEEVGSEPWTRLGEKILGAKVTLLRQVHAWSVQSTEDLVRRTLSCSLNTERTGFSW